MVGFIGPSPSTALGQYNSVAPTVADGQCAPLQTDVNGRLLVSTSGGAGAEAVNITQAAGTALDATIAANGALAVQTKDGASGTGTATSQATLFTLGPMVTGGSIYIQVTSAGSACTTTYENSNDGTTWAATFGQYLFNASSSIYFTSTSALVGYLQFVRTPYFRARVSTYGSGTVTILYSVSAAPYATEVVRINSIATGAAIIASSPTATNTQNTLAMTGSTQQVLAANTSRKAWLIQNTTGVTLYVNVGAAASSSDGKSFQVANGASIGENGSGSISTQAINALAASGSIAYSESA